MIPYPLSYLHWWLIPLVPSCLEQSCGLVEGIQLGRDGFHISHIQFANDTICFMKLDEVHIQPLKYIIFNFESIVSPKVNLSKSCLAGIGVEEEQIRRFASLLGCKVGTWSLKYLGLPVGGNSKSTGFLGSVVERVQQQEHTALNQLFGVSYTNLVPSFYSI